MEEEAICKTGGVEVTGKRIRAGGLLHNFVVHMSAV